MVSKSGFKLKVMFCKVVFHLEEWLMLKVGGNSLNIDIISEYEIHQSIPKYRSLEVTAELAIPFHHCRPVD